MHPMIVQDLAWQRTAALHREAEHGRLVAIARSAQRTAPGRDPWLGRLGRFALVAAGHLRLTARGSAA